MYAQDAQGMHVAIKMVKGGSEECKILRLLKDQPRLRDPHSFPSVMPILDLLSYSGHMFLVMPRCVLQIYGHFDIYIDRLGGSWIIYDCLSS